MKTVIVVGGSGGIGRAIILELTNLNCTIFNIDKEKPGRLFKGEVFVEVDLQDEKSVVNAISQIKNSSNELGFLVYTAGIGGEFCSITKLSSSEWDEIMNVNLKGVYIFLRELLEDFAKNNFGRIVILSSLFSVKGGKNSVAYSASKHGIVGLVKSVADEWGEFGITCNSVAPGYVRTKMGIQEDKIFSHETEILKKTPVKKIAFPEEIARVVVFLLSEDSGYINGANWTVDGGMSAV